MNATPTVGEGRGAVGLVALTKDFKDLGDQHDASEHDNQAEGHDANHLRAGRSCERAHR